MIKGIGSGISLVISFGHYGGFRRQFNSEFWRVVLGFLSLEICWFDMDFVFGLLLDDVEKELNQLD